VKLLLYFFYLPLLRFLGLLVCWLPAYQERLNFEKRNLSDPLSQKMNDADLCFEFSSEGEYQQVASIIDDALGLGKKVELVFFSPSVEKTMMKLGAKHATQIRYLRYPLLSFYLLSFSSWISAKHLILVRYDLFLDFLVWAMEPGHKLSMVWVSFKKERIRHKKISWMKKKFLKQSDKIFYASEKDQEQGIKLGLSGDSYDFRMEQIRRRILTRHEKLRHDFFLYSELLQRLEKFPRGKRLIFANVWPSDLFLLKNIPKDFITVVLPHNLTPEILEVFRSELKNGVELGESSVSLPEGNIYFLNIKGILCELYSDFGKAYVGGGFETSIHSLLEPLVAGSEHISSGPLHHRSTEFDLAQKMGHVTVVNTPQDFFLWLQLEGSRGSLSETLRPFLNRYDGCRKEIISC